MKKMVRYSLRIPKELQDKIKYTAEFNSRSRNREYEIAIKRYLTDFERLYGPIKAEDEN